MLERLQIRWDYPVIVPEGSGERTQASGVLAREDAFALVAGNDPRPLLVLRECAACRGRDDVLLSRRFDNDRTLLLTQWFHCVKLPVHVVDERHPLHNLLRHESWEGKAFPHLFLSDRTGARVVPFDGGQSQFELWRAMAAVLEREYEGDPDGAVRELLRLYPQIDRVDARIEDVARAIDEELEANGVGTRRLAKLQEKYAALVEERKELLARESALRDLPMR